MYDVGGSFGERHTNQGKITSFLYKNGFCLWRKPHLAADVASLLREHDRTPGRGGRGAVVQGNTVLLYEMT